MAHAGLKGSLCVIAGEPSGDLLGAGVVGGIREHFPNLPIWGMTGPALRAQGVETIIALESQSVMGFTQVIKKLPTVLRTLRDMTQTILARDPSAVLLIDYPGFNLRLAARLRRAGYRGRLIQMVSPSVWAHGANRIQTLRRHYDLLLTIFPFEQGYYQGSGLNTVYIGNPVAERVRCAEATLPEGWTVSSDGPLIGLFPGSRWQDIEGHLPTLLAAARIVIHNHPQAVFVLSDAHPRLRVWLNQLLKPSDRLQVGKNLILTNQAHNLALMKRLTAAIAKSGTIALELGLSRVPTVCCYAVSWINALIVRFVLRVRLTHFCMVNILENKTVFPEALFLDFRAEKIAQFLEPFLSQTSTRHECLESLDHMIRNLHSPEHPTAAATQAIADLLRTQNQSEPTSTTSLDTEGIQRC